MLHASNLTLSYGKENIIENANFSVEKGKAVVLLGENGSGKSTLLSAMATALKPKSGSLTVHGTIGYVPQGSGLFEELTFADNLQFFAGLAGENVPKTLPFDADKLRKIKIASMSGGMKKICSIVCSVISQPDILLLDEPCASLDAAHKEMLTAFLQEQKKAGITIVYVGHDRNEYESFADQYLLVGKRIAMVTPEEYRAAQQEAGGCLV